MKGERIAVLSLKAPLGYFRTSNINKIIASSSVLITTLSPPFCRYSEFVVRPPKAR